MPSHTDRLRFISQYESVSDPTNKDAVQRQYAKLKKQPLYFHRQVPKARLNSLKERGFYTTKKGVVIDGPRDSHRKPIKGAKFQILRDGIVKWSTVQRRDFIIGFTNAEKKEFALHPATFVRDKIAEIRKKYPSLKNIPPSRIQTRLQWGAYQATKDFSPRQFAVSDTGRRVSLAEKRPSKKNLEARDRLTGLHVVIHIPRKRKGKKRK